ncbi:MAG: PaaI family thioesterase [Flavobacteriales bacterium]|nr:PaaI family thioesterase [Flavobacteriales bacterium]
MSSHYRALENMYLAAPVNELYRPAIQVGEAFAEISIAVDPQFFHAGEALHGSVYFKMLDDAAFFAANSMVEDVFVLTGSFDTKLFRPVTGGKLIAQGKIDRVEEDKIYASSRLMNDDQLVAAGRGIFYRSNKPLSEISSYKNL